MERRTQDLIREFWPKLLQAAASIVPYILCATVPSRSWPIDAALNRIKTVQESIQRLGMSEHGKTLEKIGSSCLNITHRPPLLMDCKHRGKDFSQLPLKILKAIGSEISHWLCCLTWYDQTGMTRYDYIWVLLSKTATSWQAQRDFIAPSWTPRLGLGIL